MLSAEYRKEIIDLINREVVPAMGCTEPVAVSLCTARAVETLGCEPQSINVWLSPNVLKNGVLLGALAFVLVCGLIVLKELFDDFIVDDADLERKLGIPALGVIPDMEG